MTHVTTVLVSPKVAAQLTNLPEYAGSPIPSIIAPIYSLGINWAEIGVALFFIISGFVIPFSLMKYTSIQFLIARFFRIAPTYVVGFSITLVALWVGAWYYHVQFVHSLWTILTNYALVSDIFNTTNIDAVAWTLMVELKFYLVCALIIVWIKKAEYQKIVLMCFTAFVVMLANSNGIIKSGFFSSVFNFGTTFLIFMFIGTMLYFHYSGRISLFAAAGSILLLTLMFILAGYEGTAFAPLPWAYLTPYLTGLGLFVFIMLIDKKALSLSKNFVVTKIESVLSFFADISYPLYIVHGVTNYVIMRILLDWGLSPIYVLSLAVADSIIIAYILHRIIEIPSNAFGKQIASNYIKRVNGVIQTKV